MKKPRAIICDVDDMFLNVEWNMAIGALTIDSVAEAMGYPIHVVNQDFRYFLEEHHESGEMTYHGETPETLAAYRYRDTSHMNLNGFDLDLVRAFTAEVYESYFPGEVEPFEKGKEMLEKLSEQGVILAALSNAPPEKVEYRLKKTDTRRYFTYVQGAEGSFRKPAPEFYLHACKELGVEPPEALMVDNSAKNVDGAVDAGLLAAWVDVSPTRRGKPSAEEFYLQYPTMKRMHPTRSHYHIGDLMQIPLLVNPSLSVSLQPSLGERPPYIRTFS